MTEQIEIKKALSILNSLKEQILNKGDIEETYVDMYHNEIDRLIKIGHSGLDEFKIPENKIKRRRTSFNYADNSETYSDKRYVKETYFMIKLNSLLTFFQIQSPEIKIGFQDNNEE